MILSSVSLAAGLANLWLPETLGKQLPDTIQVRIISGVFSIVSCFLQDMLVLVSGGPTLTKRVKGKVEMSRTESKVLLLADSEEED